MQAITTIGLDIAKSVFQVHGVDANGHLVIRRQLKRRHVLAFFQPKRTSAAARSSETYGTIVDILTHARRGPRHEDSQWSGGNS